MARRVHLYCGLVMIPWILLYAVTGWLFNHPAAFSGDLEIRRFELRDLPETERSLPAAADAAEQVVAALAEAFPDAGVELQPDIPPRFSRRLSAKAPQGAQQELRLSIDVVRKSGALQTVEIDQDEAPASFEGRDSIEVLGLGKDAYTSIAAGAVAELGVSADELELTGAPRLSFVARIDGEDWNVRYKPKSGGLDFERTAGKEVSTKRVLARLHMTHVYPAELGAAWVHTFIVDLVAFCLLLWCLTGLLMWWQMRRFRRIGLVVLGSALVASLWVLGAVIPGMLS
ncbi:MAG: PepSY domain-containing protein [Myxococcota bacterium]